jgi:hypothetical protein
MSIIWFVELLGKQALRELYRGYHPNTDYTNSLRVLYLIQDQ